MSETIDSQRLECVCGKKLRIPANASAKARVGKCPKCNAPFEFRNREWICVAVKASASTVHEPEYMLSGESTSANSASIADQRSEVSYDIPKMSPATAEPLHQDDKPLLHGPSAEPANSAVSPEVPEFPVGQQEAVVTTGLNSTSDVVDEDATTGQVLDEADARPTTWECSPVPDDTLFRTVFGSEVAERQSLEVDQADLPHLEDDATNVPSGLATGHEILTVPSVAEVSLTQRFEQEQNSLIQVDAESKGEPSTVEPSRESHTYDHISSPALTESTELDRFSHPQRESFSPAIPPECSDKHSVETSANSLPPIDIPTVDSRAVATDFQSEHSHFRSVGSSLVEEEATEEQVGINQRIRDSIATSLGLDAHYPEHVVAAITLACHPWPDCDVSQNDIDSIAAELRPGFNINHPSMLEVAIDRLLRFEEALQFHGSTELSSSYATAALAIESHNENAALDHRRDEGTNNESLALIASPIGLGTSYINSVSALMNDLPLNGQNGEDEWHSTVISLLGAAVFRGSRDTGIALGNEATGVSVSRLAEQLGVELPEKQFDEYLDKLDNRALDILTSRTFKLGLPETLVDIAARWNITRERVRQIETKASERLRDRFTEVFKRLGKQSISPLRCHVFQIDVLYAIAIRIAGHSRHREILSGFLADIFGPWQKSGHWIYHSSLQDRVEQLRNSLAEQGDPHGIIASDSIEIGCEGLFLSEMDRDQFLKEEFGLGNYFGIWTGKNTMRCQVAAALRKIGRPATKEELAELLEHPTQSVGSILGNIEGIVRADRYRWGFDEWIEDAYDGIYGEIEQRINEYNGSVPIHILMKEIPEQFDVADSSVKAYLASSAFVVDNGMVRMASNEEYVPRSPSRCAAAIRIGDKWGYRSLIYDRNFNGYSLGVNFDVAFANGLRPGDDLVVPVDGCEAEVSLIWRPHNLNRLVDVGRLSEFLVEQGYKSGETLILIPSREKIEIIHERDLHERFSQLQLQLQFNSSAEGQHSNDDEIRDPMLDLLGGDQ
ncbi:MAG: hypothetical protein NTU79_00875 [Planctomycetota bacterium]|nr:hypothetical protein [Planctomycetota bacterium]